MVEAPATTEAVEELTRLYRELPPRPAVEEVEAAAAVLASADAEEEARLAEIAAEEAAAARGRPGVPAELLDVLREARRNAVGLRALQQRKEAAYVVELERRFKAFDDLIQRASRVVSPGGDGGGGGGGGGAVVVDEVVEVAEARRKPELAVAVAAAATEIDRGSKGGLGLEPKSVSSLRRAASAGITPLLSDSVSRIYFFLFFSKGNMLIDRNPKSMLIVPKA
jgi:hypothetical protein